MPKRKTSTSTTLLDNLHQAISDIKDALDTHEISLYHFVDETIYISDTIPNVTGSCSRIKVSENIIIKSFLFLKCRKER